MKIFICHSSYDKWVARQISKELTASGHTTFLDEKDIKTGDSIDASIQVHLKDSDQLLVLISPSSLKSHWVFLEIGGAKALGKKIIPIVYHVETNDIPQPISSLHFKDLNEIEKYYAEIQITHKGSSKKPPAVPVVSPAPISNFEGFNIGDAVKIIDVTLLSVADKDESPKWVSPMDKYSGATAKIVRFTLKGWAILDTDHGQFKWLTKWLRHHE